jgi:hypothetical protein
MLPFIGPLISAGASLLGGLLSNKQADRANADQRDLALNSISYRKADAERAGINPIYALGAPGISYSSQVGGLPDAVAQAGQNIGRAVEAYQPNSVTDAQFAKAMQRVQLRNAGLQGDLIASQIRLMNQPGQPPAFPEAPGSKAASDIVLPGGYKLPRTSASPAQDYQTQFGNLWEEFGGNLNLISRIFNGATSFNKKVALSSPLRAGARDANSYARANPAFNRTLWNLFMNYMQARRHP